MTDQNSRYFYNLMNWLEKYIEKAGYFSDWEQRKQISNNAVIRKDMNGSTKEDKLSLLAAALFGADVFAEIINVPLKTHKEQFYKSVEVTKIDADNCPPWLRLIFYAFNEVLEGRTEKLVRHIENKKPDLDPDSPEFQKEVEKAFASAMKNLGVQLSYGEFEGEAEKGASIFQTILNSVSPTDYENFYWVPQKEEVPTDNDPAAQAATAELQELLDQTEKEKKENNNSEEIDKVIHRLEEFRDNSTAHSAKNNYAWRKLNGGDKLANLKISLKLKEVSKKGNENYGKSEKVKKLSAELINKQNELKQAKRENKTPKEIEKIEKAIMDLKKEIAKNTSPQQSLSSKNDNTKYWVGGIIGVVLLGFIVVIVMEKRRIKKRHGSKR